MNNTKKAGWDYEAIVENRKGVIMPKARQDYKYVRNIDEENTYIDTLSQSSNKIDKIVKAMQSGKSYIEAKKEIGLDKSEDDLNTFLDVADALGEKEANTKPYTPKRKPNRYTAIELDTPRESLFTKVKKFIKS